MDIITAVEASAARTPDSVALRWGQAQLTWAELWQRSGQLAAALVDLADAGRPIVVHGHKDPLMVVCFLACVRSGHPYVPIDSSLPAGRVADIVQAADPLIVLAVEPLPVTDELATLAPASWSAAEISQRADTDRSAPGANSWVAPEEPYYIIFTSGSSGSPKGVQVSRNNLNQFAHWALSLRPDTGPASGGDAVYLNQAPFSFDLSVFELSMTLASGATMVSLDKQAVARPADLREALRQADLTTWVSTPSFADLCLTDPEFTAEHLPRLELFLFCGETLNPGTARELRRRFPRADVVNTYGPTESTVAVTSIRCTDQVLADHPVLPIGTPKPGTQILIRDPEGANLPEGERGEIVILGDTVALGYLGRPDLSQRSFAPVDGQPAYRTGDAGWFTGGQLFFGGRLDFQVKLHGYRIEIEDIEANLRRVPGVGQAVVVPVDKDGVPGSVDHLVAIIQPLGELPASALRRSLDDRKALRGLVPDYMVPKVFRYVAQLPLTPNGKVDRRQAGQLLG